MARVSVIIPVYNAELTLTRTLESLLHQTIFDFEAIVVDDHSHDHGIINNMLLLQSDQRFQLISLSENSGPSAARNTGIRAATSEWIALLDADDAWLPDRLSNLLSATNNVDFVADDLLEFDVHANTITGRMFGGFGKIHLDLISHLNDWPGARGDTGYLKPLMRRSYLIEHSLYYDCDLRHGEDYILYATALCQGAKFRLLDEAGYVYSAPYGTKSRRKSPFSHTKPDGLAMSRKLSHLLDLYSKKLTADEQAAMLAKVALLSKIDALWAFNDAFRAGRIDQCALIYIRNKFVRERSVRWLRRKILLMKT